MIYFDNAATSRPKPDETYAGYDYYAREIGVSPGRGSYSLAIKASRMLYQARKTVADFFCADNPANVIFTKNSTEAINLFFRGYLRQGDHVLISPYEHNAVLRPLHFLKEQGIISYTVLPEKIFYSHPEELKQYVSDRTRLFASTLASNLTGQLVFNSKLAKEAHKLGLTVFVDSSQGAGKKLINLERDNIDLVAFTGHKDLYSMPGVGGLVSSNAIRITPLIQGGTGIHGESYINPDAFPDSYEAGTLNMPAIWSLKCGIDYINNNFVKISEKEKQLLEHLCDGLKSLDNVTFYNPNFDRVPTICFNVKGKSSSEVVAYLDKNEICVRGGIHCAILAHETIGTVETGAVRVSLNFFNEIIEIDKFLRVIEAL